MAIVPKLPAVQRDGSTARRLLVTGGVGAGAAALCTMFGVLLDISDGALTVREWRQAGSLVESDLFDSLVLQRPGGRVRMWWRRADNSVEGGADHLSVLGRVHMRREWGWPVHIGGFESVQEFVVAQRQNVATWTFSIEDSNRIQGLHVSWNVIPVVLSGSLGAWVLRVACQRYRRNRPWDCSACGYDLRMIRGVHCPECGQHICVRSTKCAT